MFLFCHEGWWDHRYIFQNIPEISVSLKNTKKVTLSYLTLIKWHKLKPRVLDKISRYYNRYKSIMEKSNKLYFYKD